MPETTPEGYVRARWLPIWSAQLPDGRTVNQGDEALIKAGEAAASDHWDPVVTKPAPKPTEKAGS